MPRFFAKWICLVAGLGLWWTLRAQPTYHTIVEDTIVTLKLFPHNAYLLNGKKLNLSVMEWFMSDYPSAYDEIRGAILTDQVSVTGYSIGAVFLLTGFFINEQNPSAGDDLLRLGAFSAGAGLALQLLSHRLERRAVASYNAEIRHLYRNGGANLGAGWEGDRVVVRLAF